MHVRLKLVRTAKYRGQRCQAWLRLVLDSCANFGKLLGSVLMIPAILLIYTRVVSRQLSTHRASVTGLLNTRLLARNLGRKELHVMCELQDAPGTGALPHVES